MIQDHFSGHAAGLTAPARQLIPVAPNDGTDLAEGLTRGLFVGQAGIVSVQDAGGNIVQLISGASQYHPIRIIRVRASDTTATNIVALY